MLSFSLIGPSVLSSRHLEVHTHPIPMAITAATTPSILPGTQLHETARHFSPGCRNISFPARRQASLTSSHNREWRKPMQYSTAEMMAVAAARTLKNDDVCFVGIGAPSVAC